MATKHQIEKKSVIFSLGRIYMGYLFIWICPYSHHYCQEKKNCSQGNCRHVLCSGGGVFVTTANEKKEKNYNLRNVQRCDVSLHDKTQLDFVTRNSIMFYMSGNHSVKSRQIEFLNENGRKSTKKKRRRRTKPYVCSRQTAINHLDAI